MFMCASSLLIQNVLPNIWLCLGVSKFFEFNPSYCTHNISLITKKFCSDEFKNIKFELLYFKHNYSLMDFKNFTSLFGSIK